MIKTNVVLITQKLLYMLLFSYIQMKEVQVLHVYAIKNTRPGLAGSLKNTLLAYFD